MNDLTAITVDQLREARAALSRPAHLAEGLPGRFYGPSFYALEQQTLFPRSWCAVSVASALPEPGDVLPIELAGWPIILVRGHDGEIRAFHNICRHRSMRPVSEPCNVGTIRCPWHAWAYDLQGALLATPQIGGAGVHELDGFDKPSLGLKPIPVGIWLDYVFVNIDGAARPFAEYIAPANALLAELDYDLDGLRHGARIDDFYEGNWKLSTEGGIEDYHLPFGHPQLQAHKFRNTNPCFADGVYTGGWIDLSGADEPAPATPARTQAQAQAQAQARPPEVGLPPILTREGRPSTRMLVINLFPTGTILVESDHLMVGVLLPDGPSKTKVELHFYFKGDAATSAEAQPARERRLAMWREVIPQDFPFVIGTQSTIAARDAAGIRQRFSPYWELPLLYFQRMVLDAVDDPTRPLATV